jgi:prevent-host-death family protein
MKRVALAEVKDHFSEYLDHAAREEIVITRHGKPAGVLVGFATEDDWFDYRLENDPRFLEKVAHARADLRAGRGIRWPDAIGESAADNFRVSDQPATKPPRRRKR